MGKFIDIGNDGFRSARKTDYVDKSLLIDYVNGLLGSEHKFLCVTRARRFGKSMAAKMLNAYYDENSLACALNLAYYVARKDYTVVRELPTGKGFADLVLIPHVGVESPAIVVELKYNKSADTAIRQIREKHYLASLKDWTGAVVLVGINYDKKTKAHQCVIERVENNEPHREPLHEPHLTERQKRIIVLIQTDSTISKEAMADELEVSLSTIKREMKSLPVRYEGTSMDGRWVIDEK